MDDLLPTNGIRKSLRLSNSINDKIILDPNEPNITINGKIASLRDIKPIQVDPSLLNGHPTKDDIIKEVNRSNIVNGVNGTSASINNNIRSIRKSKLSQQVLDMINEDKQPERRSDVLKSKLAKSKNDVDTILKSDNKHNNTKVTSKKKSLKEVLEDDDLQKEVDELMKEYKNKSKNAIEEAVKNDTFIHLDYKFKKLREAYGDDVNVPNIDYDGDELELERVRKIFVEEYDLCEARNEACCYEKYIIFGTVLFEKLLCWFNFDVKGLTKAQIACMVQYKKYLVEMAVKYGKEGSILSSLPVELKLVFFIFLNSFLFICAKLYLEYDEVEAIKVAKGISSATPKILSTVTNVVDGQIRKDKPKKGMGGGLLGTLVSGLMNGVMGDTEEDEVEKEEKVETVTKSEGTRPKMNLPPMRNKNKSGQ